MTLTKGKKWQKVGLSKNIFGHPKSAKMWPKWQFFDFFSKMAPKILMKLAQNVELINSEQLAKTTCQNLFPFLRYSSTKFRFWPKMAKVVPKSRVIARNLKKIWLAPNNDLVSRFNDWSDFPHVGSENLLKYEKRLFSWCWKRHITNRSSCFNSVKSV